MRLMIEHRTTYRYAQPVSFGTHRVMVRPREGHDVHIESSLLDISPAHRVRWLRDTNGNSIAVVDFTAMADRLSILSQVALTSYEGDPPICNLENGAAHYPFVYDAWDQPDSYRLSQFYERLGKQLLREGDRQPGRMPAGR